MSFAIASIRELRMKSVCLDARMLGPCGIGVYIHNLIPFLQKAPFQVHALIKPEDEDLFKQWKEIKAIPMKAPIYSIKEQLLFPLKIPTCDLFWSPHFNVPLLPIRALKRLVTIHDAFHLAHYATFNLLQKTYVNVVMRAAVRLSDQIITVSRFSKNELIRFMQIPEKKLQVIYQGMDHAMFQEKDRGDEAVLAQYLLPKNFLLFVGHLRPHKNLNGLLSAFDLATKNAFDDLSLVVIAERDQAVNREKIEKWFARFPHLQSKIQFLGHVPAEHLAVFYRRASAFVLPSFYEGFGLPPLEAMSSGCPTIVSECASLPEVCGDAAIYIDPHSPDDIARAITTVLKDGGMRQELKLKSIEQSGKYCWNKCAEKHLKTIETLLHA